MKFLIAIMATAFRSWVLGGVFEPCSLIVLYVSSEVIVYILKLELYIDRCGNFPSSLPCRQCVTDAVNIRTKI